jgi:tripartite-type tricarboxylate transporter receptor subunit TctC
MKLPRRRFLHLAAGAAALTALPRIARAQAYPTRPVRLIVPIAPAGNSDILARLMGQWLSEQLGQPFIIEVIGGGGGNIGTEAVVRAPADGYTLLMVGIYNASNATLYDKLNFNFIRDIAPVAGVFRGPSVLVVNPSVPAKSVPEFIAYAKAQSRQGQHRVGRYWDRDTCGKRTVPDDGGRQDGSRAISWWRTCFY